VWIKTFTASLHTELTVNEYVSHGSSGRYGFCAGLGAKHVAGDPRNISSKFYLDVTYSEPFLDSPNKTASSSLTAFFVI